MKHRVHIELMMNKLAEIKNHIESQKMFHSTLNMWDCFDSFIHEIINGLMANCIFYLTKHNLLIEICTSIQM